MRTIHALAAAAACILGLAEVTAGAAGGRSQAPKAKAKAVARAKARPTPAKGKPTATKSEAVLARELALALKPFGKVATIVMGQQPDGRRAITFTFATTNAKGAGGGTGGGKASTRRVRPDSVPNRSGDAGPAAYASARGDTPMAKEAFAYTAANGLPEPREITVGPPERRVTRIVVPVLPETMADFQERFTTKTGGILIQTATDKPQIGHLVVEPGDHWVRGLNMKADASIRYRHSYENTGPGHIIAIDLGQTQRQHLVGVLKAQHEQNRFLGPDDRWYEWLSDAKVGPETRLFHALHVSRSHSAREITAKLIHGGNEKVQVVGRLIAYPENFAQMTPEQLAGRVPANGPASVIKTGAGPTATWSPPQ